MRFESIKIDSLNVHCCDCTSVFDQMAAAVCPPRLVPQGVTAHRTNQLHRYDVIVITKSFMWCHLTLIKQINVQSNFFAFFKLEIQVKVNFHRFCF